MKKIVSIITILSLIFCIPAFAQDKTTDVRLDEIMIEVPFAKSEVLVERQETDDEVKIFIKDKKTGEILSTYGEIKETIATRGLYSTKTIYQEKVKGPAVLRLYTKLYIYNNGSFREIDSVVDTWWSKVSSGDWDIDDESESTVSTSGSFPTGETETTGDTVIVVETTMSTTGSFSISALEMAGFGFDFETSGVYYFRQPIDFSFVFSLY